MGTPLLWGASISNLDVLVYIGNGVGTMKMRGIILAALFAAVVLSAKILFYPSLESIDTKELQVVSERLSPDGRYVLKTYLMGGVLLRSDFSYIGEIEYDDQRRKVFWISGNMLESPKWVDDHTIEIAGRRIDILHDQYDFRWE
jgi:hypothetical protein